MSFLTKDKRLKKKNIEEFNSRGWTLIDLKLSQNIINNTLRGLENIRKDAIKKNYKPRRIYYDHLISNNLSAIELPFNKSICNKDIHNLFIKAKIGSLIKSLMNWQSPCCDLSRLFCMGDFKYRGNWHRDYKGDLTTIQNSSSERSVLLAGIYLTNQKGFRILKKDYDFNGIKTIIKNEYVEDTVNSFQYPLNPPSESYYEIEGKVGHVLFFDPFLMHQGSTFGSRFDFHMKFYDSKESKFKRNIFQDFDVIDILDENLELPVNSQEIAKFKKFHKIPFDKKSTVIQRIRNSIDYRIGLRKILKFKKIKNSKYKLIKKSGWNIDWFSNTQWQK